MDWTFVRICIKALGLSSITATTMSSATDNGLKVLFLVSAHNSLSQRAWIALTELGHEVTVAVVDSAAAMEAAVSEHRPEQIVCRARTSR